MSLSGTMYSHMIDFGMEFYDTISWSIILDTNMTDHSARRQRRVA